MKNWIINHHFVFTGILSPWSTSSRRCAQPNHLRMPIEMNTNCAECRKVRQTETSSDPIHASSIKWIGEMFFENSLSGYFYARGNSHANRLNRVTCAGKRFRILYYLLFLRFFFRICYVQSVIKRWANTCAPALSQHTFPLQPISCSFNNIKS